MLRFIVLGEIPGTGINLSFAQVMLILGAFYLALLAVHEARHHEVSSSKDEQTA